MFRSCGICFLLAVAACGHQAGDGGDTGGATSSGEAGSTGSEPDVAPSDIGDGDCEFPGPDGSCSVWCQDCPDGQKCMPTVSDGTVLDATACVDIADGAGGLGDSCQRDWGSGVDDCGAGLMCWDVDTESGGFCAPFCTGSPDEPSCPDDRACLQYPPTFEQAPVCLSFCDPTASAPCGNALSCLPVHPSCTPPECLPMEAPASFFCLPQTANTVNQSGWPCDEGLCRADMICAPQNLVPACMGGDPGCCTPYCDLDAPDCTEGTCQSVFDLDAAPPGLEHVGACLL